MTIRARVDADVIYHDASDTSLSVGVLSEHTMATATSAQTITGTATTAAVQIVGTLPLSTLAVKNTGSGTLRVGGSIDVPAGRLAVLPVTATVTVASLSGSCPYTAIWIG